MLERLELLTVANVTITTNAANIPIGFSKDLIEAIRYELVLQKTVTEEPWTKADGQTIVRNRTVNWEKQIKVPGVDITPTAYVGTSEMLFIDIFEYSALLLEDFAKIFIPDNVLASQVKSMAYALGRGVDVAIGNLFQSFSQTVTGTAYNVELTYNNLATASRMLRVGGVKPNPKDTFTVISPNQTEAFKTQDVWINKLYDGERGGSNFDQATLGQSTTLGTTLVESMLLRAPGAGGHDGAMYSRDAIRMAFAQDPEYFEDYIGLSLGTLKGYKQAYGLTRSYRTAETPGSSSLTDSWAVSLPQV